MAMTLRSSLILVLFLSELAFAAQAARADAPPTYEKQIAPFFKTYCLGCHDGGDDSKAGLSLLTHKSLLAGGDGGAVIVAGNSRESRLVQMLLGAEQPKMPPKDAKQPKAEEIELVRHWIDLGAKPPVSSELGSIDELALPRIQPKVSVAPAISSVAYSRDGHWLAAARHREVLLLDASGGTIVTTLTGAENPINAIAFSPDGRLVAAAEGLPSVGGNVRIWEVPSREKPNREEGKPQGAEVVKGNAPTPVLRSLAGHVDSIYAIAFSPDGRQLVSASYDKLLILWDVDSGAERHTLKHHTAAVFGVAFSPDGKALASVAADQTVKLWNVADGQRILTLTEPTKPQSAVAFHPQGHEIAVGGVDKMIRVYGWNGTIARLKRSAFAHDAPILALVYSPDGQTLFSSSEDRRIKAWDVGQLRERHVYEGLADWPLALAVSPSGEQLAAGLYNGELPVFDARSPAKLRDGLSAPAAQDAAAAVHASGGTPAPLVAALLNRQDAQPAGGADPPKVEAPLPNPPTPRLDAISPRTVVRGSKVKLTLGGQNVSAADQIFISHGNLKANLLPADEKNANAAFCEIDIPADLPPGTVALRLHTPLGTAGSKSFYVGPFPEVGEKEDNNVFEKATAVSLPATLVGSIDRRGDRDLWSFETQAGQELVFLLIGPNLGSSLQARLTLRDVDGKVIQAAVRQTARSEVVLGRRFETAGKCYLEIEDRDNTGGGNHFYYVHAGTFPYVTGGFPLGMRAADQGQPVAGEVAAIELDGFNLAPLTRLTAIPGVASRFIAPNTFTTKAINSVRYEASPFAEFAEVEPNDGPNQAQVLPVPGAVSGRIAAIAALSQSNEGKGVLAQSAGGAPPTVVIASGTSTPDADHFAFEAKRGDRLTIETFARRLGSPIDTVIDILDANGQPVPRHTLRAVAETYIVLRDHESRTKGIRLQAWDDLLTNDFVMVGAEVLKVQVMPLGPDEDVKFFDRLGPRTGYFGTTPQAHAINTAAFKVEIHPPGVQFPPNGMPVVTLDWRNDDAPGLGSDSQVLFDVPSDGRYVARVRDVRDLSANDFVYRLVIRPRQEDFRISLDPENPNIPRGGSLPITVTVDRLDGFNGNVDIRIDGLPDGITATTTRIGPDLHTAILTLTADDQLTSLPPLARGGQGGSPAADSTPEPRTDLTMRAIASAVIDGKPLEHASSPGFGSHHVTITSPPDLKTTIEPPFAEIAPGQELRFTATIERRNGFKGRVPVEVLNLPHGLRVLDVGLNGVLINEDETSRSFVVACDPWAEPGPLMFYAAAKVEAKNERHAAPGIRLEVKGTTIVAGAGK
ncbi:MAG: hypothetical protein EXS05_01085 [Planctomycetaceae bacterium]|nr:hypothetical protein [Planctomycetaceae bacterium]